MIFTSWVCRRLKKNFKVKERGNGGRALQTAVIIYELFKKQESKRAEFLRRTWSIIRVRVIHVRETKKVLQKELKALKKIMNISIYFNFWCTLWNKVLWWCFHSALIMLASIVCELYWDWQVMVSIGPWKNFIGGRGGGRGGSPITYSAIRGLSALWKWHRKSSSRDVGPRAIKTDHPECLLINSVEQSKDSRET